MPSATSGTTTPSPSFLPSLMQPLLSLIQPTPLSFPPPNAISLHPPTTSVLGAIHTTALECLNNAFLSIAANPNPLISSDVEAGRLIWDELWRALGAAGIEDGLGQERRKAVWEVAVGVLWGVGLTWPGKIVGLQASDGAPTLIFTPTCRFQMRNRSMS